MPETHRHKPYLNKQQEGFFAKAFGVRGFACNKVLEEKLQRPQGGEKIISIITPAQYTNEYPLLKEPHSLALANVQLQQEEALASYFKNKEHFRRPKFNRRKDKQPCTKKGQNGTIRVGWERGILHLPRLKEDTKTELCRKLEDKIKSVNIIKPKTGKHCVFMRVNTEEPAERERPTSQRCGIGSGLSAFAVITSYQDTFRVENPRYPLKIEKRLKQLQRAPSRKQKASNSWTKQRQNTIKLYEHASNTKMDFLHKLSKAIIGDSREVEDLSAKAIHRSCLSKSALDVGLSMFLTFRAQWHGMGAIVADRPDHHSRPCPSCGYPYKELRLNKRIGACLACRIEHRRDKNTPRNLYNHVGLEQSKVRLVNRLNLVEAGSSIFFRME